MKRYRELIKDTQFTKISIYAVLTATFMYIAFFLVKDYEKIFNILLSALQSVARALSPLWIGIILAYLLNPIVSTVDNKVISKLIPNKAKDDDKKKKKKTTRFISIFITYITIFVGIIAIFYAFTTLLIGNMSFSNLDETLMGLKDFVKSYTNQFNSWISNIPQGGAFSAEIQDGANNIIKWFASIVNADNILGFITSLGSQLFNFFMGVILSIYLISDKEFFHFLWKKLIFLIAPRKSESISGTLTEVNNIISKFLRGVFLDSFIIGSLIVIGLSLANVKFALFLGIFAGITNVIPYFGPFIGMIPAFIVATFSDSIWKGLLALVIMFIIQQIDANVTYPKIVGSSIGLRPLFVLLSILVFGYYLGILGMIIAVPVTSILQLFISRWAKDREMRIKEKISLEKQIASDDNVSDNIL